MSVSVKTGGTRVGDLVAAAARRLGAAGVDNPRLDARLLVAHALGLDAGAGAGAVFGYPEREMPADARDRLERLLARRARREPLAKIVGQREFWSLPFKVTAATLDPRPDSETVVEAALASVRESGSSLRILDLGTGSGCLLLALLHELPGARGLGVDRSEAALAVARENAAALGLAARAAFMAGDWGRGIDGIFDCIVANPPYIPEQEIASLAPEVAEFEPVLALSGGPDGLECYRDMAPHVARLLVPGGTASIEVGAGQAREVAEIFGAAGLTVAGLARDLAGQNRCVIATH